MTELGEEGDLHSISYSYLPLRLSSLSVFRMHIKAWFKIVREKTKQNKQKKSKIRRETNKNLGWFF